MAMPAESAPDFSALRERLDALALAPHRKALGYHWLNTGVAAGEKNNTRLAEHCRQRLGDLLRVGHAKRGGEDKASPWEAWDKRFRQGGLTHTLHLIQAHGQGLTAMERRTYRGQLETFAGGRAGFWALRRSILSRLLRSRLNALRPPPLQNQLPPYGLDMPVGPYNHRKTLESALRLVEGIDPGWTRDFLRLYTQGWVLQGDLAAKPVKSKP